MTATEIPKSQARKFSLGKVLRENPTAQGLFLISPANLYLIIFIVLPLILITVLSFLSRGTYGNVVFQFNSHGLLGKSFEKAMQVDS